MYSMHSLVQSSTQPSDNDQLVLHSNGRFVPNESF
jgi:hypothetical protein